MNRPDIAAVLTLLCAAMLIASGVFAAIERSSKRGRHIPHRDLRVMAYTSLAAAGLCAIGATAAWIAALR